MPQRKLTAAVVLAAGEGSRFWPYNVVRQKAAFPIANVPNVRRIVDDLAALGVNRIVVVVGRIEASVRAALRSAPADIRFVQQGPVAGTAAAALAGAQVVGDDCLVVAGDVVTARANLAALIEAWAAEPRPALALVQRLGHERPQDWLVAYVEGDRLVGVAGHPRDGEYRLAGVYALSAEALPYLRDNPGILDRVPVGGMPPLEAEMAMSLQMMVDERLPVGVVEAQEFHVDLDKPWHIMEANRLVIEAMSRELRASGPPPLPAGSRIHDGADIEGQVVMGKGCTIGNRVVLRGDVWLGDGARILNGAIVDGHAVIGAETLVQDYCLIGGPTSLGPRGIYSHGAEFDGVALDTVYCYHYCEIFGVVGQAVDFGAATVCGNLRFDDGRTTWRIKGRPETPLYYANAAYFGDFSRTGVNAIIMPGRRIGVYSVVGAGVVAYEDIPDRQLVTLKQELVTRPWGPERYGW
ncbi:MAG TPA: NTP transferase domain-containing protein [Caldilineaceae bacterium]|nr:NTP transferase domain-containing protein [Caldilineaceae bacterium]